jgi:hypothetical protein
MRQLGFLDLEEWEEKLTKMGGSLVGLMLVLTGKYSELI